MSIARRVGAAVLVAGGMALGQHTQGDAPPGSAIFFKNLGSHHRTIRAQGPRAEGYFDQGLRLIYAFNLEEAERAFDEGARADPTCAMCHWGKALALGPNINLPANPERNKAAYAEARWAVIYTNGKTGVERDLAEAIAKRYAPTLPADDAGKHALEQAYADAMREVARKYPNDADVQVLFAESLMDLRPWDLWSSDGKPQPGTEEVVSVLEGVLASHPDHPGANHYYIHAVEASPNPEKGLAAAGRLAALMPGAGHVVHMPAHIYMRVGRYEDACEANRRAIRVDGTYLAELDKGECPAPEFYSMYIGHNYQFLSSAAMMQGRSAEAVRVAREMLIAVDGDMLKKMPGFDAVMAWPIVMEARFGHWEKVLGEKEAPRDFPFVGAMRHYARGLAFLGQSKPDEAEKELAALTQGLSATPAEARELLNSAKDLLAVARDVLAGRLALSRGKTDEGLELLRKAVAAEDGLHYDEPPDWIAPVRHALGAALLKAGRGPDAEKVYRDDLAKNPENGWALFGLVQSLKAQGKPADAEAERLKKAWANADFELTTTWY